VIDSVGPPSEEVDDRSTDQLPATIELREQGTPAIPSGWLVRRLHTAGAADDGAPSAASATMLKKADATDNNTGDGHASRATLNTTGVLRKRSPRACSRRRAGRRGVYR
jgi:hypothetical protein